MGKNPKEWYLYAPAFGVGTFVKDPEVIHKEARSMIKKCGAAASVLDIEVDIEWAKARAR